MIRAVDKEFSLCDNYTKGHREIFREWIETYHPVALLLHVDRESGSYKELDVKGTEAVYMNLPYWIYFLDECLRMTGDNILQENIFKIL